MPEIAPELCEPHLSCRVMAAVVHELEATRPDDVEAVLDDAGLPRNYVVDAENWVSTEYVRRFAAALAQRVYGLDDTPPHDHEMWQHWRRAARLALRPEVVGPIYGLLRALGSPGRFYAQVPALHQRANRTTTSELRSRANGRAVLSVRPAEGGVLESPNCWFQYGLFEAIPTLWGLEPATVEHRECTLDPSHPAEACVYRISFTERRGTSGLSTLAWMAAGAGAGASVGIAFASGVWSGAIVGALAGLAADGWRRFLRSRRFARREFGDLHRLLQEADERQAELWNEHMALRRSMLVTQKLSGYLASDLTERILEHPELQLELGGSQTQAAVMFVDIVGFTARSERLDPEQLVEELNIYFRHIDPNVVKHDGVIDKRIGDGVMAVFVAREGDQPDVSTRAVRCAMDMLRSLEACNAELRERGAEPLQVRIGIAAGGLVQGNMGSDVRLEYTVIGNVVNLAARLESAAPHGSALIPCAMLDGLTSERERLQVGAPQCIRVKGRHGTFDVIDIRPK